MKNAEEQNEVQTIRITRRLVEQVVTIMKGRYVSSSEKDPNATLSEVRDKFMKKHPRWWERAACALVVRGLGLDKKAFMINLSIPYNVADTLDEVLLEDALERLEEILAKLEANDKANANKATIKWVDNEERLAVDGDEDVPELNDLDDEDADDEEIADDILPEVEAPSNIMTITMTPSAGDLTVFRDATDSTLFDIKSKPNPGNAAGAHLMMTAIEDALRSVARNTTRRDLDEGDLDLDRLTDIGAGTSEHVFKEDRYGKGWKSTVCQLMIDCSGSMSDKCPYPYGTEPMAPRWRVAQELGLALGEIFDKLGLRYQILLYDDRVDLAKGFDVQSVHTSLLPYQVRARGGTQLPSALNVALQQLNEIDADRRVSFILTDGDVGSSVGAVLSRPEFTDIETCAFGLGPNANIEKGLFTHKISSIHGDIFGDISTKIASVMTGGDDA